jgi:hypothetical protein
MDTFLTATGVVVTVLAAVATVWVTFTVGFPRRRLYYGMQFPTPLLSAPHTMRDELELRLNGQLLSDPSVLTLQLLSRGRRAIPSEAYNDRQPLLLDVGADIIRVLQANTDPDTASIPLITIDGTVLKIGPSLIDKRQEITITILTDGGRPSLTCKSSLVDVQVGPLKDRWDRVRWRRALESPWIVSIGAGVIVSLIVGLIFDLLGFSRH